MRSSAYTFERGYLRRSRLWISLSLSSLLLSCGAGEEAQPLHAGEMDMREAQPFTEQVQSALEVCASGETTFGIDVSAWQGEIDWDRVAAAGVKFAVIRAADSTGTADRFFAQNWSGAGRVGILRGVYQYFRPSRPAVEQARHMIDILRTQGGGFELPPVIDVEEDDGLPPEAIQAAVRQWIDHVEAELGVMPIIYTGFYFWRDEVGGTTQFNNYPLWHAQYTGAACPRIADAWPTWLYWQYSSTGRVEGIDGNVDMNRFNGSEAELRAYSDQIRVGGGGVYGGQPRGQSFPLAADPPIELCVGERFEGEMYVENSGSAIWGDEVRLAPIPRDEASPLWDEETWLSPTRVTSTGATVSPGERGVFRFSIQPQEVGLIDQYFGLVAEGITWFADAGGPSDRYIELRVNARECEVTAGAEAGAEAGSEAGSEAGESAGVSAGAEAGSEAGDEAGSPVEVMAGDEAGVESGGDASGMNAGGGVEEMGGTPTPIQTGGDDLPGLMAGAPRDEGCEQSAQSDKRALLICFILSCLFLARRRVAP